MTDEDAERQSAERSWRPGPIAWMAEHALVANLLMLFLMIGGLLFATRVGQEVFPEIRLATVDVRVPYPGAAPEEVEQGIILAVEEAIRGIEGIDEVRSVATEGLGRVSAELRTGADADAALDDIESAVDRITSFPDDAEEAVVGLRTNRRQVLSIIVSGPVQRRQLEQVAERIRTRLLQRSGITQVAISDLPPPEIDIAVPQEELRRFGFTPDSLARRVDAASVELPTGTIRGEAREIQLRAAQRREGAAAFAEVPVIVPPAGGRVPLERLATVTDGYRETDRAAYYDGAPALRVQVYRVGRQTPLAVSAAAREVVEELRPQLPDTIDLTIWNDSSTIYEDRIRLLVENGIIGLLLVLVILALFLRPQLAFWVTIGIPITFAGVFLAMAATGITINMISLFAFLLVLGIVVDDAIVVGEAAFHAREEGQSPLAAAITGARSVVRPVVFAVFTTIAAFTPLLFVPGVTGKFFVHIPGVVIPILCLSLIESLFILPAHVAHGGAGEPQSRLLRRLTDWQSAFGRGFERLTEQRLRPLIDWLLHHRGPTLAALVALLLVAVGYLAGGHIGFRFLPRIEGDIVTASVELPRGVAAERTRQVLARLESAGRQVAASFDEEVVTGILTELGSASAGQLEPGSGGDGVAQASVGSVALSLTKAAGRDISAATVAERWRQAVGSIAGLERLAFTASTAVGAEPDVAIQLAHADRTTLERAAERLAERLGGYAGVRDIDDGFHRGEAELRFAINDDARSLGLTEVELARQVRGAVFGIEVQRHQEGREEERVYLRRPLSERDSLADIEAILLRTPGGGEIPLTEAADLQLAAAFTRIEREGGRRVVEVTADTDPAVTTGQAVTSDLQRHALTELQQAFPELDYELSGQQQRRVEALEALAIGMALAVLVMYVLMAIAFDSAVQPLLILLAIPFGLIGALAGHLLMGFQLSIVSVFGFVALAGVVVNDSLVLIDEINKRRRAGADPRDAALAGSLRRFRPVLLTSLTTFVGLTPMIFETSVQARFLIPMAISLGYGVLFVTVITLLIVPAGYLLACDLRRNLR